VPPLTKADVEGLLVVLSSPPGDLTAEVDGLRTALTQALTKVLGREGAWDELVTAARLDPDLLSTDLAKAREAMWDLAALLNEERELRTGPPSGQSQREAVSAIERAIKALAGGNADAVRRAAASIADLDRGELYVNLPAALEAAAGELEQGSLSSSGKQAVIDALGPGPLAAEAEQRVR